jgi:hypothetical protein
MPIQRPHPSNYPKLNSDFYDAAPWQYFEQRLAFLMLVTSDPGRCRDAFAEPMELGPVRLDVTPPTTDRYPTPEQSYTAVEAEVLLHHVAETLLRFVHAHADPDEPCPWIRMSALTSAKKFKDWVETTVATAASEALAGLCGRVFACRPDCTTDLDAYVDYMRLLAEHFLDSGPYNAAKHGMGLAGGSERRQIEVDGLQVFRRDGAVISWLAVWPLHDAERAPRWTRASRLFSAEVAIALISLSTNLMKSIWIRGRAEHLSERWDDVFRPPPPHELLAALEVRHLVLADWYEPLPRDEHDQRELIVKTSHVERPDPAKHPEP